MQDIHHIEGTRQQIPEGLSRLPHSAAAFPEQLASCTCACRLVVEKIVFVMDWVYSSLMIVIAIRE